MECESRSNSKQKTVSVTSAVEEKLKALSTGANGPSDAINQAHDQKALRDREEGILTTVNEALDRHQERL